MGRKRGIKKTCGIEGCMAVHYAKSLCKKHYYINYNQERSQQAILADKKIVKSS